MLQAFQSIKITGKGKDSGRAGRVVRDDGETIVVQLDGDTETKVFKASEVEAL